MLIQRNFFGWVLGFLDVQHNMCTVRKSTEKWKIQEHVNRDSNQPRVTPSSSAIVELIKRSNFISSLILRTEKR